jgi:hypothetical protein
VPRTLSISTSPSAEARKLSIGVGFDARRADFWSFRGNYPLDFFSDATPDSCFVEEHCSTATVKHSRSFSSRQSWQQAYVQNFGIELEGGHAGFTGGFGLDNGESRDDSWQRRQEVLWASITRTQKCFQFRINCLTNPDYLSDRARELLEQLPYDTTDAAAMRYWAVLFIQRFGTHIAVHSSHGAMIQATSVTSSKCEWSSACRTMAAEAKLGFLRYADLEANFNHSDCTGHNGCEETAQVACAAVGGDPATTVGLCGPDVAQADLNRWLASGNPETGSSTISLELRPISEVLMQMGFWDQALQMETAAEYYACRASSDATWQQNGEDDHGCQCTVQCMNGGVLDPLSCTCTCPGDETHGFVGPTCEETYGKCVRGVGASDTPSARGRACKEGNMCGGIERTEHCGDADVCCNTDSLGTCCPFGSYCDCDGRSCLCKTPGDNFV